ncbi:hypothetical protein BDN72DRAFT_894058 [Pluteus cervinus]|uniref:Uncharacterized protein n=1 Tax=Pluteus cervinus TaxID=181527 RepID=A0ACD3B6F3_9AGAR|nr:hypothetical protein BDN72DRAFT_894058 [Pluteus cervinus]
MSSPYTPVSNDDLYKINSYLTWYYETLKHTRGGRKAYKFKKTYRAHMKWIQTRGDVTWILDDMSRYYSQLYASSGYHRSGYGSHSSSPSSISAYRVPLPYTPPDTPPWASQAMPAESYYHERTAATPRQSERNTPHIRNGQTQNTRNTAKTSDSETEADTPAPRSSTQRVQIRSPKSEDDSSAKHEPPPKDAKPERSALRGGSTSHTAQAQPASPEPLPGFNFWNNPNYSGVEFPAGFTPFSRPHLLPYPCWPHQYPGYPPYPPYHVQQQQQQMPPQPVMNVICPNGNALGLSGVAPATLASSVTPSSKVGGDGGSGGGAVAAETQTVNKTPVQQTQPVTPAPAIQPTQQTPASAIEMMPQGASWYLTPMPMAQNQLTPVAAPTQQTPKVQQTQQTTSTPVQSTQQQTTTPSTQPIQEPTPSAAGVPMTPLFMRGPDGTPRTVGYLNFPTSPWNPNMLSCGI